MTVTRRQAQELLETTTLPISRIATLSGFTTPLLLRQHFTKTFATTPTTYRRTFRHVRGDSEVVVV